ncbi:MAG: serine/threonine-protein kinase [Acidobacteriota bacterium]
MFPFATADSAGHSWQRTEELFYAACELPESERRAFLIRSCAGNLAWVEEIERLLGAEADADARIEGVIARTMRLARREGPEEDRHLNQVGSYQILRELGRGGMSTVYLAERADEHYRQQVALKVVKRGMDTQEILRRLRQERQILAQLEHPHISRLLDGGNTEDGRPYFVMEFVDGEPIDRYCQRLDLSIEDRIALFRDVLSAVAYAHRNLVVHRDLKPANILVTGKGTVKLLDFGIAKLLDPERAAEFGATSAAMRFFTLDYASPEQILGRRLNTASDVYSLGALLYELLSGEHPHDRDLGRRELEQAICDRDPPAPSARIPGTAAEQRTRRRKLSGDLDAIVLAALQRQPDRRYASIEPFAEDLRRYAEGLPVRARRPTLRYRTVKLLRSYRRTALAAAAVVAMLTTLVTFYTSRLASERNRARIEERKSDQVASFLRGLFENADPARGPQVTARELLDQGAARIETELADQPEARAELMDLMGSVYLDLGLTTEADPLLKQSERFHRERFGDRAPASLASRLHRAQWLQATGDYAAAETAFQTLVLSQPDETQAGTDATESEALRAKILGAFGDLLYAQGRPEAAETRFRQALQIRRSLFGEAHPLVATSLNDLGVALYAQGALEAAEEPLRQALELRRRLLGASHPHLAISLSSLGVLRFAQQDHDEARELLESALDLRRRLYGDAHPAVAQTLNNLGEISRRQGDLDAAVGFLTESLEIAREVQGIDHPLYAGRLMNLARTIQMRGDHQQALPLLEQAVSATRSAYGDEHERLVFELRHLGDARASTGDRAAAEAAYREAIELGRQHYPRGWRLTFPLLSLGTLRLEARDPQGAEPWLAESVEIRRAERPDHWRTAEAQSWLGRCWVALGRRQEGLREMRQAQARLEQELGSAAAETLAARMRLEDAEASVQASSSSPQ